MNKLLVAKEGFGKTYDELVGALGLYNVYVPLFHRPAKRENGKVTCVVGSGFDCKRIEGNAEISNAFV